MKINKKITTIGIIVIALIVLFCFMIVSPWAIMWFGLAILPNPPKPETSYSEFAFQLEYELNNEIVLISDNIICEFEGFGERTTAGQSRTWNTYIENESNELDSNFASAMITLLDLRDENILDDSERKILELYFYGGNAYYYMGDKLGNHDRDAQEFNYITYVYQNSDGSIGRSSFESDYAYERFGIRLISFEADLPIDNSFHSLYHTLFYLF